MPPSPQLRRSSPGRELRVETSHKRGHSFESRLPLKAKDDDLVLFNEMQNHERENFLLHTSEDFDDSISKLKHFPDFKLGLTIPPRGESSDMLNVDAEKNDYDWLLTPPDTPLFPSLDDEPQPLNMSRGRTRTQPISISKPSTVDRNPRTSRSSASPHRLSPSPRSNHNAVQSRARPSSAPRSSPPPVRPTTPLRRPSTPPAKPSTPTPRSSTPTMRRMSTGSTGSLSSNIRGTSPVKSTRGNSASPKLRGWQTNLPGFSTDAPPNLRTSLPDRPSSRVRGLSPASGNGRDLSSKVRRQSVSPSATRSANLLHNTARDVASYSKASVTSSGDDDADSVHSVSISVSDSSVVRKYGSFGNNRTISVSKKPSTTHSAGSAPKRSFDSALRQMDQRKTPPNMFRPLLSSVPATTFYVGRANSTHRPLFSRNSSLTTSSNASSERGVNIAPDMEDSDHEHSELTSECEKQKGPEIHDEIFVFDKLDGISEDFGHDIHADNTHSGSKITNINSELDYSTENTGNTANNELSSSSAAETSDVSCKRLMGTCSICGKDFLIDVDAEGDMCQDCTAVEGLLTSGQLGKSPDVTRVVDALDSKIHVEKEMVQPHENNYQVVHIHNERSDDQEANFCSEVQFQQVTDVSIQQPYNYETDTPDKVGDDEHNIQLSQPTASTCHDTPDKLGDDEHNIQQSQPTASTGLSVGNFEGTGISVLLMQGSSSGNYPVVQGRAVSASNILCSEPSYARDNMSSCSEPSYVRSSTSAMKCSFGRESSSASSSIDLGPSKQTYGSILHQLSAKKFGIDNVKESSSKSVDMGSSMHKDGSPLSQSRSKNVEVNSVREGSSTSSSIDLGSSTQVDNPQLGTKKIETEEGLGIVSSTHAHSIHPQLEFSRSTEPDVHALTETEEVSTSTFMPMDNDVIRGRSLDGEKHASQEACVDKAGIVEDVSNHSNTSRLSTARPLSPTSLHCHEISGKDNLNDDDHSLCGKTNENFYNNEGNTRDIQEQTTTLKSSFIEDNRLLDDVGYQDDISDLARNCSSLIDLEKQNLHESLEDVHKECIGDEIPINRSDCVEETPVDKHVSTSVASNAPSHPPDEEPVQTVEAASKPMQRICTLEEATDTVLFCSSIVHDIAYKAATIGMQKDSALSEPLRPTVTILGNSVSHQMDLQKGLNKRVRNARKAKRKSLETDSNLPSAEAGHVKTGEFEPSSTEISHTVDSMKPPKPESKCNCTVM